MATAAELAILIRGDDKASKVFKDVKKSAGGLGKALSRVGQIAAGVVIARGITKLPGFLVDAAQAAADDAASMQRLQRAVENADGSFDKFNRQIDTAIKQGQRLGFTDDQTRDSLSLLTAQTNSTEEAMKRYTLAMDLARGANIDVETASRLLGKVTEENVNVLARYGISVKKGASETELFAAVYEKFNGQAQTFADSTAGKMARFKDQMSEIKEAIGTAILPVLTNLATFAVNRLGPALQSLVDYIGPRIQQAIAVASPAVMGLVGLFGRLASSIAEKVFPVITELTRLFQLGFAGGDIGGQFSVIEKAVFTLGQVAAGAWQGVQDFTREFGALIHLFTLGFNGGEVGGEFDIAERAAFRLGQTIRNDLIPAFNDLAGIVGQVSLNMSNTASAMTSAAQSVEALRLFLLGLQTIGQGVLAVVTEITASFAHFVTWLNEGSTAAKIIAGVFATLTIIANVIPLALIAIITALGALRDNFDETKAKIVEFTETLKGLPDELADILYRTGVAIIDGLWRGMKDKFEDVKDWLGGVGRTIIDKKGPINVDRRLLSPTGFAIMEGLEQGLQSGFTSKVQPAIKDMTGRLTSAAESAGSAFSSAVANAVSSTPIPLMASGGGGGGASAPAGGSSFAAFGSFQHGTPYVPHDMLAYLHRGEAVVPAGRGGSIVIDMTGSTFVGAPSSEWRQFILAAIRDAELGGGFRNVRTAVA